MGRQKLSTTFLTLSRRIKVHLLLRYCIKNLSIGVSQGALLNLFWIFEYVTSGPFAGPLSVDFTDVQEVRQQFSAICILNFNLKTSIRGVKIYSPELFFIVLVNRFPTYGRSSNFRHWMGGG